MRTRFEAIFRGHCSRGRARARAALSCNLQPWIHNSHFAVSETVTSHFELINSRARPAGDCGEWNVLEYGIPKWEGRRLLCGQPGRKVVRARPPPRHHLVGRGPFKIRVKLKYDSFGF